MRGLGLASASQQIERGRFFIRVKVDGGLRIAGETGRYLATGGAFACSVLLVATASSAAFLQVSSLAIWLDGPWALF